MHQLIGREVTVKELGRRGWVAELDEHKLLVRLYSGNGARAGDELLIVGRAEVVVHRNASAPTGLTAVHVETVDGVPWISLRLPDELIDVLRSVAYERQLTLEQAFNRLLEDAVAA